MQPDRSDYEIWIADWLAGNPDSDRKKQLEDFLADNPDLKEEAESLLLTSVEPGSISFPRKDLLKKSPEDFTPSQVEYLSAAYLENDLSPEQIEELNICLAKNPELRLLSESVRKIKLSPPDSRYNRKRRLKKQTMAGRILKISWVGLSAAASVAILVTGSVFISRIITEKKNIPETARLIQPDLISEPEMKTGKAVSEVNSQTGVSGRIIMNEGPDADIQGFISAAESRTGEGRTKPEQHVKEPAIQQQQQPLRPEGQLPAGIMRINDIPAFSIRFAQKPETSSLMAVSVPYREPPYDGRNTLSRLIARTFREKILRDDSGSDAPVRTYEIASAGINGISRLFGLEMSLTGITDSQGDLKSLYFSSRLVKFNAPLKKDESLQ